MCVKTENRNRQIRRKKGSLRLDDKYRGNTLPRKIIQKSLIVL